MKQLSVAIIGSGPAGYTAGIYTGRAKLNPTLFAGEEMGGQLMFTTEVENFPGFPEGIMGPKLMDNMKKQAERFGTQIVPKFVTAVDFSQRPFKLWSSVPEGVLVTDLIRMSTDEYLRVAQKIKQTEADYTADSVIIATGAVAITLGVPGEKEFMGRGVSVCAVCDAAFFKDKKVYVVGGGDAAMEDTLALTKFAKEVYVIHRRDAFRASKVMQERVLNHPKVKVLWNSEVKEVAGEMMLNKMKVVTKDPQTGKIVKEDWLEADGLFLAIGHRPVSNLFADQLKLDSHGYVLTRKSLSEAGLKLAQAAVDYGLIAYPSMTSVEGVFAAGDVVDVRYKQAITAAGQGCEAALDAERWLEDSRG